jgi:hypothetical protein
MVLDKVLLAQILVEHIFLASYYGLVELTISLIVLKVAVLLESLLKKSLDLSLIVGLTSIKSGFSGVIHGSENIQGRFTLSITG